TPGAVRLGTRVARRRKGTSTLLGLANGEPSGMYLASERALNRSVAHLQDRPTVTLREHTRLEHPEHVVRQFEQAHRVRDRGSAATEPPAHLLLAEPQLVDQRRARPRRLYRVEVFARHVLDQGQLEALG